MGRFMVMCFFLTFLLHFFLFKAQTFGIQDSVLSEAVWAPLSHPPPFLRLLFMRPYFSVPRQPLPGRGFSPLQRAVRQ